MSNLKNSIFSGLAFGLFMGIFFAISDGIYYAIFIGPLSGLFFGLAIYFFITSKTIKQQTEITNLDGQAIVYAGSANHFKNGEAVGGKLYLLPNRLQFKSHSFNIQNHELTIALEEIKEVKFYYTMGLIPNGLEIVNKIGNCEKFVVNNRKIWKEKIEINSKC
jgi:hypothetical protein